MRSSQSSAFTLSLPVVLRLCAREDLDDLEWFGVLREQRALIHACYERQLRGEALLLVATINGFAVGQTWVDLIRRGSERIGVLSMVRVMPCLHNQGIGTRLVAEAERLLLLNDMLAAEVRAERDNKKARRFSERMGYALFGEEREELSYETPDGVQVWSAVDVVVLRKQLMHLS